jgi:prepilin-type processing-associated H-X9-DG protein
VRKINIIRVIVALGIVVLIVSLVAPTIRRARMTSGRVPCASNLRQIGQALLLYSRANGGMHPPSLQVMSVTEDIHPEVLHCADGGGSFPFIFLAPSVLADSYTADDPIVYEPAEYHDGAGGNVLFGDGHVEFVQAAALKSLIQRAATRPAGSHTPSTREPTR